MRYSDDTLFLKQFGKHIKVLRKKHNFTQRDLSDICELEEQAIQRIERGYNSTLKTLLKVANAFNIPFMELFNFSLDSEDIDLKK